MSKSGIEALTELTIKIAVILSRHIPYIEKQELLEHTELARKALEESSNAFTKRKSDLTDRFLNGSISLEEFCREIHELDQQYSPSGDF